MSALASRSLVRCSVGAAPLGRLIPFLGFAKPGILQTVLSLGMSPPQPPFCFSKPRPSLKAQLTSYFLQAACWDYSSLMCVLFPGFFSLHSTYHKHTEDKTLDPTYLYRSQCLVLDWTCSRHNKYLFVLKWDNKSDNTQHNAYHIVDNWKTFVVPERIISQIKINKSGKEYSTTQWQIRQEQEH